MDLVKVGQSYVDKIVTDTGIKVLLLDDITSSIISLVSTQSELLNHQVYLIDKLENENRDTIKQLDCVCFLSVSETAINLLVEELGAPKYKSYKLYFNNVVPNSFLERLAERDDLEMVDKVMELFLDYDILNKNLFSFKQLNIFNSIDAWNQQQFLLTLASLKSLCFSLQTNPIIRYESNSRMCSKLASDLSYEFGQSSKIMEKFPVNDIPPVLLILDRKNDPITPLLNPWTYQSMVHELLGIFNNTVDLTGTPSDLPPDLIKLVLNPSQDPFYAQSLYLNFGDLSDSIKTYVNEYKEKTVKHNSNELTDLNDMKHFLESFPEFKKLSDNISKHMGLITELDRKINENHLWQVSELEQSIAVNDNHNADLQELEKLLTSQEFKIANNLKVKLVCLYAIRYELHPNNQLPKLLSILLQQGVPEFEINTVNRMLKYSGSTKRLNDDSESSIFNQATNNLLQGFKQSHENDNIYMQHIPRLERVISKLVKNKLPTAHYPTLINDFLKKQRPVSDLNGARLQDIIIFFVGGVTYEEARIINNFNLVNKSTRIVIGGTTVHNTNSFMTQVLELE
ncbi:hypothetical protein LJB42_000301 [Komagataella kurtzmanii]|nr:hypothetical protein LJB42_000301 [Komagataella kurtzmanii]